MFRLALLAISAVALATGAKAEMVGACAWHAAPTADHELFLNQYRSGMQSGMAALRSMDGQIRASVAKCAQREDVPRTWAAIAVASQAIQEGAAQRLSTGWNIQRVNLDAAWENAPGDARQCVRANAAKIFGLMNEACPNPKAPLWFLSSLGISGQNAEAAGQALIYVNAKAQSEWAEAAIAKFKTSGPSMAPQ